MHAHILQGGTLSEGLNASPNLFSTPFRSLLHLGERSGLLSEAMDRAARQFKREADGVAHFLQDLVFPAGVVILGAAALAVVAAIFEFHGAQIDMMWRGTLMQ